MNQEDRDRLHELESMLDDECDGDLSAMDDDDRAELRELRAMVREEKRTAKALAKFDKARIVWQVTWPKSRLNEATGEYDVPTGEVDRFYTLDKATAEKMARDTDGTIEEVARQALTGRFFEALAYTDEGEVPGYCQEDEVIR